MAVGADAGFGFGKRTSSLPRPQEYPAPFLIPLALVDFSHDRIKKQRWRMQFTHFQLTEVVRVNTAPCTPYRWLVVNAYVMYRREQLV